MNLVLHFENFLGSFSAKARIIAEPKLMCINSIHINLRSLQSTILRGFRARNCPKNFRNGALSCNSKTLLFAPFSASSKAASRPTYASMSCEAALKSANDLFVVISPLEGRGKTNYLPMGAEGAFGRPASLNHEEPPPFREKIFKKSIKNQKFRITG